MDGIRNVSSNKGIFDISNKEITISLAEYTDLITRKTVLEQVRHAVAKDDSDYGSIAILKAILQIDLPEKK